MYSSYTCVVSVYAGNAAQGGGECEVVVVASQVRGHGLWDGDVDMGGLAHTLLFLWVTDAQAKLLQTELSIIHPVTGPGKHPPCYTSTLSHTNLVKHQF